MTFSSESAPSVTDWSTLAPPKATWRLVDANTQNLPMNNLSILEKHLPINGFSEQLLLEPYNKRLPTVLKMLINASKTINKQINILSLTSFFPILLTFSGQMQRAIFKTSRFNKIVYVVNVVTNLLHSICSIFLLYPFYSGR